MKYQLRRYALAWSICIIYLLGGLCQDSKAQTVCPKGLHSLTHSVSNYIKGEPWNYDGHLEVSHHKNLLKLTYSGIIDNYISPIAHTGYGISITSAIDHPMFSTSAHTYSEWTLHLYRDKNRANQTEMYSFGGDGSIGPLFKLLDHKQWLIEAGPLYSLYIDNHLKLSNGNNPYNLKASTGLNGYARCLFRSHIGALPVIVSYGTEIALLHCTYHIGYGQSYYDYVSGENRGKIGLSITTPYSRTYLRQRLLLDFPIHSLTYTLGIEHTYLRESTAALSDLHYYNGTIAIVLGISLDSFKISGSDSYRSKEISDTYYH